jgi:hypothetical protein
MINEHKILFGKPEVKKRLETPGCKWEDNINIYFKEIGWGSG